VPPVTEYGISSARSACSNGTRLVVAAIEHREIAPLAAALHAQAHDLHRDALGLVGAVARHQHADPVARAVRAPQPLLEQVRVVGDQAVGRGRMRPEER
jgi:hypothetical protein